MTNIPVTNHAKERLSERGGFKNSSTDRIASIAFEKGIEQKETNGKLQKLFAALYLKSLNQHNNKVIIKIYGRQIYIFNNQTRALITVLPLDKKYYTMVDKLINKKKVENK